MHTEEEKRLEEARLAKEGVASWRTWGPYLSERQWGTVREDYSENEDPWNYFTHAQARSRAYRWGEDGIAGISDDHQQLCFAIALWNGKDPILKERLFGLTGDEGNHGEDVKEYYFYLDNLPSHAYMKYLYKYPQNAYPYDDLVKVNQERTKLEPEYELLDTGIFDENRYFDVFVEYAKASPEELLIQISVANRGPDPAEVHLLPTLWFRNTWSWSDSAKPALSLKSPACVKADHPVLGSYFLSAEQPKEWLFTENETNKSLLFSSPNDSPYTKDGIGECIIRKNRNAVNPAHIGTKCASRHELLIAPGKTEIVRLRLSRQANATSFDFSFEALLEKRKKEADAFYQKIAPFKMSADLRNVQRQALAGMLWNKQYYRYNVNRWLNGDPDQPPSPEDRKGGRNSKWKMLDAADIFSMPDKWEYPWFAAWDLAFHTVTLALIDPDFAKNQLLLLTKEWYMHPSGQIPAYEWDFGDVNPPVHAWAAYEIYVTEQKIYGRKDRNFLEKMFQKLVLNFTWWVNKKDKGDRNIFEGGFLGLDNISAFDRSKGVPEGGVLFQVDGTSWMGMYCLNLLQMALELAIDDPVYEDMATKFFEHFIFIADAMNNLGGEEGLWDEKEGFYHGVLYLKDGSRLELNSISLIGVTPLFAVFANSLSHPFSYYRKRFEWFMKRRPEFVKNIVYEEKTDKEKILFAFASPDKLRRILEKVLDESELLSPFGIRSVSKQLDANPFSLRLKGEEYSLNYEPAESTIELYGGNSNWRGPIWFPINYLAIEALRRYHSYLGDDFKIECPKGSGRYLSLKEVAQDLSKRLLNIFLKDPKGHRPVYGAIKKFQTDPHWKDYLLFHEYFHGDNGSGLGASNQTGWTGLAAKLIQEFGEEL
jgi:hypothetical protein